MDNNSYSLVTKLGLKPNQKSYVISAPTNYHDLVPSATLIDNAKLLPEQCDWLQAFYVKQEQLAVEIDLLKAKLSPNGQLWISWPKKASKVESDLSDNVVRQIGLNAGLVDIKIASIDEIWSGLKFVYRRNNRY